MWLPMWVFDGNGFTMAYLVVWTWRLICVGEGGNSATQKPGNEPHGAVRRVRMRQIIAGTFPECFLKV
jgi:hypothetical protein